MKNIKAAVNVNQKPVEIYIFGKILFYKKAGYTYFNESGKIRIVLYFSVRYYFFNILIIERFEYNDLEYFNKYPND